MNRACMKFLLITLLFIFLFNNLSSARKALFRTNALKIREAEVEKMIKKHKFFCTTYNPKGAGFKNDFVFQSDSLIVYDRASGLYWQRSRSPYSVGPSDKEDYINKLNKDKYAGYSDWRLPTLEEAMSLISRKYLEGHYTHPYFGERGKCFWTADKDELGGYWYVSFEYKQCNVHPHLGVYFDGTYYVRAVRSDLEKIQQPPKRKKIKTPKIKKMSEKDVEKILKKNNFFDTRLNPNTDGTGNKLDMELQGMYILLVDKSLGIMWYALPIENKSFLKAQAVIKEFNDAEWAGYNGWRIPTLKEATSLIRKEKKENGEHLPGGFSPFDTSAKINISWTCDISKKGKKFWTVDFGKGTCVLQSGKKKNNLLMVRSIKE